MTEQERALDHAVKVAKEASVAHNLRQNYANEAHTKALNAEAEALRAREHATDAGRSANDSYRRLLDAQVMVKVLSKEMGKQS